MQRNRMIIKDMVYCSFFAILIAVGAFIKIPIPVCPFTLQFFFTTMAGVILGAKRGAVSVSIYTLLGLVGLPVFAEGGGIWYVMKPTFGYMLGFIIGSFVTGYLVDKYSKDSKVKMFLAAFAGLLFVYAVGMIYYYILSNLIIGSPIGVWPLFLYCFILAVPGDIVLCILVSLIGPRIRRAVLPSINS